MRTGKTGSQILISSLLMLMAGCNVFEGKSVLDLEFRPGLNGSVAGFNQTYHLTSAESANYVFDSSRITLNSTATQLSSGMVDQGNAANGFGGGTLSGVVWDATTNLSHPYLRLDQNVSIHLNIDSSWTPYHSDIIAYWALDGTLGAIPDGSAVGSTTAVVYNLGSGTDLSYVNGKVGQGMKFNSITSYATIPQDNIFNFGGIDFSVSLWFNMTHNTGGGDPQTLIDFESSGWNGWLIRYINNGGPITLGGSGGERSIISTNPSLNKWHHLVATYSSTTHTLVGYLDGKVEVTTNVTLNLTPSGTNHALGTNFENTNQHFLGGLDEVAIWKNRELSADDVSTIYLHQSAKHTGIFTSRVLDATNSQAWTNFSWASTLPFLKALPDNATTTPASESSTNYVSISNSLMDDIVGLWHLDEAAAPGAVVDHSGHGHNGTTSGGPTFGVEGLLSGGVRTTATSGVTTSLPTTQVSDVTLSIWAYATTLGTAANIFYNGTSASDGYGIGIDSSGVVNAVCASGLCTTNSTYIIPQNQWVHLAMTVTAGGSWTLYANGVSIGTGTGTPTTPTSHLLISDSSAGFVGSLDEAAIWDRTLSPGEILQLYRRGANRIKFQVRTCGTANAGLTDCTDSSPWQGPDNTNLSHFSELYNTLTNAVNGSVQTGLPSMLFSNFGSLNLPANRYFQYRAILESDDDSSACTYASAPEWCSPELRSIFIGVDHFDSFTTITNSTGLNFTTLGGFTETLGTGGCSAGVLYNLSNDNITWYYWDGSVWAVADGTIGKASTAVVINSNISNFATQIGGGALHFKAFLQSDGVSDCQLSSVSVTGKN